MVKLDIESYVTDIASTLVRINTENPPGREFEAASYLAEKCAELGLRTSLEKLGENRASVVALVNPDSKGPTLMFNSHLDTVPAGDINEWQEHPFSGVIKDGKLYGRGAADAKASLAAMMGALKILVEEGAQLNGKIIFAGVADEEMGGRGTVQLIHRGYVPDYVVVGEPTDMKICLGNRGRAELAVKIRGIPAHASTPSKGLNSIVIASDIVREVSKLEKGYGKKKSMLGKSNAAVTIIEGGVKSNVIPEFCEMKIDWRLTEDENIEGIKRKLDSIVKNRMRRWRRATYEIKVVNYSPAVLTPKRSKITQSAVNAIRKIGKKPTITIFQATTDLSRIAQHAKTDGIILGPGSLSVAHASNEYVNIEEITESAKVYAEIARQILA